jgi:phosphatidylinositol glycan class Z
LPDPPLQRRIQSAVTMWRRVYFLLILVRIYFALSPSYLHPDENFQGPEVIAGMAALHCISACWRMTD